MTVRPVRPKLHPSSFGPLLVRFPPTVAQFGPAATRLKMEETRESARGSRHEARLDTTKAQLPAPVARRHLFTTASPHLPKGPRLTGTQESEVEPRLPLGKLAISP